MACIIEGGLILSLIATLGIVLQTSKAPQANNHTPTPVIQALELAPAPDFNRDVLIPLRQEQAAAAAAEAEAKQQQLAADLDRTRDRVRPIGFYGDTYAFGNCTAYVASRVAVPGNWGNANTWFWSAQFAGWPTGSVPRVGAIATTTSGWAGHVALVEAVDGDAVLVSEMNVYGFDFIDSRWVAAGDFAYIY